jgi:ubiquinone/menaquinone biosynthesis C-methylase UbiE
MPNILQQAAEIRKIWSGFQGARVLITANNYRVFDHLEKQSSANLLSKKLRTDLRATEILLDALSGLGLLKKQKGTYENTGTASRFLVTGKPYYQGDIIRHIDTLWDNWSGLDTILRTGSPFRKSRNHEAFILGMHNLASLKAKKIIDSIGVKGVQKALDLGAGPGTYALDLAGRGIQVTLFDTPETIAIAKVVVSKHKKKAARINFRPGDFIDDDIGKEYDLVFMSQIAHSYSDKDNIMLLKKCRKALNPGGRAAIQEFLISDDRTTPLPSVLFSINMLVNTTGGRCYSPKEMRSWFQKAGFRDIKKQLVADGVLVIGSK